MTPSLFLNIRRYKTHTTPTIYKNSSSLIRLHTHSHTAFFAWGQATALKTTAGLVDEATACYLLRTARLPEPLPKTRFYPPSHRTAQPAERRSMNFPFSLLVPPAITNITIQLLLLPTNRCSTIRDRRDICWLFLQLQRHCAGSSK
jgi:hypothetical protein